jgi:hypothetical protein
MYSVLAPEEEEEKRRRENDGVHICTLDEINRAYYSRAAIFKLRAAAKDGPNNNNNYWMMMA